MSFDDQFMAYPCYKKWMARNDLGYNNSLIPLRIAAMKVMSHCYYINDMRPRIFSAIFKNFTCIKKRDEKDTPGDETKSWKHKVKLMKASEKCLETFLEGTKSQVLFFFKHFSMQQEIFSQFCLFKFVYLKT